MLSPVCYREWLINYLLLWSALFLQRAKKVNMGTNTLRDCGNLGQLEGH